MMLVVEVVPVLALVKALVTASRSDCVGAVVCTKP